MPRYHTKFLLSATNAAQFPPPGAPEIAFLGRSNVGKSSMMNALLGAREARVSSTPGRTRAINFFGLHTRPTLPPDLMLADLPGYGYAKISRSISAEWPSFIGPYLAERETLVACICLVDMNVPPQESDLRLAEYLTALDRRRIVVGTKADKLSGNRRTVAAAKLRQYLSTDEVLVCSAKDGRGIPELWKAIYAAAENKDE